MDFDTIINSRFSCRNFISKKVSITDLNLILEAGIKAPSAGNLQDFRFVIVVDENKNRPELLRNKHTAK